LPIKGIGPKGETSIDVTWEAARAQQRIGVSTKLDEVSAMPINDHICASTL